MLIVGSFWPQANLPVHLDLVVFMLWVEVSRISLGARFPADMLAELILSLIVVWLLRALAKHLGMH
jgi:hypothetical protein